eukprot:8595594-Pyramimonas_sp.AAC.1
MMIASCLCACHQGSRSAMCTRLVLLCGGDARALGAKTWLWGATGMYRPHPTTNKLTCLRFFAPSCLLY